MLTILVLGIQNGLEKNNFEYGFPERTSLTYKEEFIHV